MDTSPWDTVTTKSAGDDEEWTAFGDDSNGGVSENDNSGWADSSNISGGPAEDGGPRASSPDALIDHSGNSEPSSTSDNVNNEQQAAGSLNSDSDCAHQHVPESSNELSQQVPAGHATALASSSPPPSHQRSGTTSTNIKEYEDIDSQNTSIINNTITMEVVRRLSLSDQHDNVFSVPPDEKCLSVVSGRAHLDEIACGIAVCGGQQHRRHY